MHFENFMTYDSKFQQIRIFIENKKEINFWGDRNLALDKAQEYKALVVEDKEEFLKRFNKWKSVTESSLMREKIYQQSYIGVHGEFRWKSNDRCIPMDCFKKAKVPAPRSQERIINQENREFIHDYIEQNKGRERSPSEMEELRSNFEPGTVVVDVLTGDNIKI